MIYSFAPFCALFLATVPVVAQPIGRPEPVAQGETPTGQVEATVREFVANLNGSHVYFSAVNKVADVRDYGFFGGPAWSAAWEKERGSTQLQVEGVDVFDLTATSAQARVTYFWKSSQPRFRSQSISETLSLRIGAQLNFGPTPGWQIVPFLVPETPAEMAQVKTLNPEQARAMGIRLESVDSKGRSVVDSNIPILNEVARDIANPKAAWALESGKTSHESLARLRQLGLGALQFTQDYDEKFAFAPEFYQEAIRPYLHKDEAYKIPATGEFYTFNANLSAHSSANIANSSHLVLFYEGQNEQPVFRYAGRAAILFVDGHAALVSPEEAKLLVWKP